MSIFNTNPILKEMQQGAILKLIRILILLIIKKANLKYKN